ncbi:MAG: Hsp20/alpha crystallin family protein [Cyanobacteria bacterium]|nr:Hsp20/alpha crystallin family protein [Cyanobacteriota bacterium]
MPWIMPFQMPFQSPDGSYGRGDRDRFGGWNLALQRQMERQLGPIVGPLMEQMLRELNALGGFDLNPMAGVQFRETEEALVVSLRMPGIEFESATVQVSPTAIAIAGQTSLERSFENGMSHSLGQFQRLIPLPAPVRTDAVSKSADGETLTLILTKANPGPVADAPLDWMDFTALGDRYGQSFGNLRQTARDRASETQRVVKAKYRDLRRTVNQTVDQVEQNGGWRAQALPWFEQARQRWGDRLRATQRRIGRGLQRLGERLQNP